MERSRRRTAATGVGQVRRGGAGIKEAGATEDKGSNFLKVRFQNKEMKHNFRYSV